MCVDLTLMLISLVYLQTMHILKFVNTKSSPPGAYCPTAGDKSKYSYFSSLLSSNNINYKD